MPSKPGRKASLGDAQKHAYLEKVRAGLSEAETQEMLGVSRQSVYRAMKADPQFGQGVQRAKTEGKYALIAKIREAAEGPITGSWTAAAWLLERKWYQEFARRNPDAYSPEQFVMFAVSLADIARRLIPAERHGEYNAAVDRLLKEMEAQSRGKGRKR